MPFDSTYREAPRGQSPVVRPGVRPEPASPMDQGGRALDLTIACLALLFLAPLLLLLCALVRLDGGPAMFRQERIGRGGKVFRCLKLRSMVMDADARLQALLEQDEQARAEWARDHKLRTDPRITPFGRFLRKSSLDELPQLLNVIRGDMNIVGPRPIVAGEIDRYRGYFRYYCSVRPGITGLWQVSGRNNVSYRRRVACDVIYARTRCVALDIQIIAATVPAVVLSRGSY